MVLSLFVTMTLQKHIALQKVFPGSARKTVQEVAREIFEEIDKILMRYTPNKSSWLTVAEIVHKLAELKKKYLGE